MKLSEEQLNEIAESLEMNLQCFVHKKTGDWVCYPDPDEIDDPEPWQDLIEKVEQHRDDYIHLTPMDSFWAYRVMERFVFSLEPGEERDRLEDALSRRRPFRNFNYEIHISPYRDEWFAYRRKAYIRWAKDQLEYSDDSEE